VRRGIEVLAAREHKAPTESDAVRVLGKAVVLRRLEKLQWQASRLLQQSSRHLLLQQTVPEQVLVMIVVSVVLENRPHGLGNRPRDRDPSQDRKAPTSQRKELIRRRPKLSPLHWNRGLSAWHLGRMNKSLAMW